MNKNYFFPLYVRCFFALTVIAIFSISAQAQVSVVVSSSSTQTASDGDVKAFFSAFKFQWSDGSKVKVADQAGTDLAKSFYEGFVGRSVNRVRKQWTKLILSGQASAPLKCHSDDEVKKALSANPNAIGYISTTALDDTVKEILRIGG